MNKYLCLLILSMLAACAPTSVDMVESLQPTEAHHVAELLPPAWTETPTSARISTSTSTAAVTVEPTTVTPDSMMIPTTPDPNAAQVLFVKKGECTVMSVSSSGGGAVPVTLTNPEDCAAVKISPDGKQVAYFGETEKSTIFLANVDGSEEMTLAQLQHFEIEDLLMPVLDVIWSPNGEWLAVASESAYLVGYGDLYLFDLSGNREMEYVALGPIDPYSSPWVSWSPDDQWLSYYCLISYMGSEPDSIPIAQRLSDSHYNVINHFDGFFPGNHLEWSSDSKSLAIIFEMIPFSLSGDELPQDQQAMTIAALSGGEVTEHKFVLLPKLGKVDGWGVWDARFGIRWAPNGNTFLALQQQSRTLSVLNLDGTLLNEVISLPSEPLEAGWSPDGQWIYVIMSEGSLEIVRPDGTDHLFLAEDVAPGSIVWK